jgi:hypothetical protein
LQVPICTLNGSWISHPQVCTKTWLPHRLYLV